MIYSDNCCCCVDLKCGSILIAIVEVLIRGLDRFFVDLAEGVFVATEGIMNEYLVFDILQSLLGLYFWLVVYSYYDRLKDA
uniref:HDC05864 n=1 Tax=Drosophila melanogaster TaxID=7227 RepID=Q6IGM8_DROME|nr:TPA_inf: HDC05864 [Drosophila melanogaster]